MSIILYTFLKILKKYRHVNIYFHKLKLWAYFCLAALIILGAGNIIKYGTRDTNNVGHIIFVIGNYGALLVILFRPRFLNRTNLKISLRDSFTKKTNSGLTDAMFMEIFVNKAYYLDKEASVEGLSKQLNISAETVKEFIYTNYGIGFTDLVNKHRVTYFIDLVSTGNFNDYTIDALAQEAGFSSRHHLYKPFKKFHGGTPSDFMRSIEK